MHNLYSLLIIVILLSGCQSEFQSKDQAKNEINAEGYRTGRWIDYLDADENKTLYPLEAEYYLLSEFKDGKPVGGYRLFNQYDEILRIGSFEEDTILYDKFNLPIISLIGTTIYFENRKIIKKSIVNEKMLPIKTIDYFYDRESNKVDSFIVDWTHYPTDKTKTITFSNTGKNRIVIQYDESRWADYMDNSIFFKMAEDPNFMEKLIDNHFKGKFPAATIKLFKEIMSDGSLLVRINTITDGELTVDLKGTFQEKLVKLNKAKKEPTENLELLVRWVWFESFIEISSWIKDWEERLTHDLHGAKNYKNRKDIEERKLKVLNYYYAADIVSLRRQLKSNALENDLSEEEVNKILDEFDLAYKRVINIFQSI